MSKVLLIDDELDILELTSEGLGFEGFEVITAINGVEGLHLIRDELPDIVVCDINMPEMNGFEVLENLRDDLQTSEIPFIFLSALSQQTDIREGMKRGADDYLLKPVSILELSQTIHSRLARQSQLKLSRLRDFAQRLVLSQENERRNFTSILKNTLGDKLADIQMSLDTLQYFGDPKYNLPLQAASRMLDETLKTIHKLSYSLAPAVLGHLGLEAAILSLIEQIQENSDFQVAFDYYGLASFNDPNMIILLYRIVQEAIENCKQHAQVNRVSLKLWAEEPKLFLQIEDKGVGFDVQTTLNQSNRLGLLGMMERAFLLAGELHIISNPNEGTRVYAQFPLRLVPPRLSQISSNNYTPVTPRAIEHENNIRLAIADSSELSRWAYSAMLETDNRFKLVAQLENWDSLIRLLEDIQLDLIILSHNLDAEPSQLLRINELRQLYPHLKIVFLSNYPEYSYAKQVFDSGADAYLLKTSGRDELFTALEAVLKGKQHIAKAVVETKQRNTKQNHSTSMDSFSNLTDREREIFYYVIAGKTNQEIANVLVLSTRTVESHRLNMMRKLGITGTAGLINYALSKGLLNQ